MQTISSTKKRTIQTDTTARQKTLAFTPKKVRPNWKGQNYSNGETKLQYDRSKGNLTSPRVIKKVNYRKINLVSFDQFIDNNPEAIRLKEMLEKSPILPSDYERSDVIGLRRFERDQSSESTSGQDQQGQTP